MDGLEKSVEKWLDQIVGRPTQQLGLLLGDTVRKWRFNNQLRILNSAKDKCLKHNISIKIISPKLLCPLLDFSSLEEDPIMQDKWANLLMNMLDSEQNIQNHVLPVLLSQISKNEFQAIDTFVRNTNEESERLTLEWVKLEQESMNLINEQSQAAPGVISEYGHDSTEMSDFNDKYKRLLYDIDDRMHTIQNEMLSLTKLKDEQLSSIEFSNLTRLGILQSIPRSYATGNAQSKRARSRIHVSVFHDGFDFEVTELGYELFRVCEEIKQPK